MSFHTPLKKHIISNKISSALCKCHEIRQIFTTEILFPPSGFFSLSYLPPQRLAQVFERGLKAIPLSVDLWIHYLGHVKANHADDETIIRSQFERALAACGLEFRSDKLWEAYIKWENEAKRVDKVVALYDRLLSTPTQGYANHFDQ